MATYTKYGDAGTAGHPSIKRVPYLVENTIDLSEFDPAAGSIIECLAVPAETLVIHAGLEVLTASTSSTTMDLGITGSTHGHSDADCWVDGHDTTSTGYAPHDMIASGDSNIMLTAKTAETIDILTAGATDILGKVRVFALMVDISGVDETDRN
tara:strand:+ start:122 stop:583 length:462 start_codon:yes stop_codon:yes gene_type:complete